MTSTTQVKCRSELSGQQDAPATEVKRKGEEARGNGDAAAGGRRSGGGRPRSGGGRRDVLVAVQGQVQHVGGGTPSDGRNQLAVLTSCLADHAYGVLTGRACLSRAHLWAGGSGQRQLRHGRVQLYQSY